MSEANRSGTTAEQVIAAVLTAHRVSYQRQRVVGIGIYGTPIKADFFVPHARARPNDLIIESKWQDSSGSADEKLPYLVETILHCYPCPTIVVIDGPGFRPGALVWLRSRVDGFRLQAVYTLQEFVTWSNRNL